VGVCDSFANREPLHLCCPSEDSQNDISGDAVHVESVGHSRDFDSAPPEFFQ
jgi:hypothetical protein